jgi:hypothetical protein
LALQFETCHGAHSNENCSKTTEGRQTGRSSINGDAKLGEATMTKDFENNECSKLRIHGEKKSTPKKIK